MKKVLYFILLAVLLIGCVQKNPPCITRYEYTYSIVPLTCPYCHMAYYHGGSCATGDYCRCYMSYYWRNGYSCEGMFNPYFGSSSSKGGHIVDKWIESPETVIFVVEVSDKIIALTRYPISYDRMYSVGDWIWLPEN